MGTLVRFDKRVRLPGAPHSSPPEGEDATILIFTGVRYEHGGEIGMKPDNPDAPLRPGRQRG